jgi:hypothetical protein
MIGSQPASSADTWPRGGPNTRNHRLPLGLQPSPVGLGERNIVFLNLFSHGHLAVMIGSFTGRIVQLPAFLEPSKCRYGELAHIIPLSPSRPYRGRCVFASMTGRGMVCRRSITAEHEGLRDDNTGSVLVQNGEHGSLLKQPFPLPLVKVVLSIQGPSNFRLR